jgi:hypothetical protein
VCKEPENFKLENTVEENAARLLRRPVCTFLVVDYFMVNDQKGEWLASWLVWGAGSSALSVPGHLSRPILGIKNRNFLLQKFNRTGVENYRVSMPAKLLNVVFEAIYPRIL